jgi:CheY-like chemotaxis protein
MRILVADDCSDTRNALAGLFQQLGHDVVAAADGAQAIQLALERAPHIAFLDIAMPQMDGRQAAERLHRLYPELPLVALTGLPASQETRDRDAVFTRYLVKPVQLAELVELLDRRAAWPGPLPHDRPAEGEAF